VHPNINWWPAENQLLPTTELPFLDWSFGQCDEVIGTLEDQWKQLVLESREDAKFFPKREIIEAVPVPSDGNKLTLKTQNNEPFRGYDIVIVASGFGEERKHLNLATPSYWEPDDLERLRDNEGNIRHFVVSGFGDGGLIDSLRIAYDFDFGKLSFRFAEALSLQQTVADRIRTIEANCDEQSRPISALHYEQIATDIFNEQQLGGLKKTLEDELHKDAPHLITLVDSNFDNPYQASAAPVHKLMIAYAQFRGVLRYCRCEILSTTDTDKFDVGGKTYSLADAHFVVRHGAGSFNEGLITPAEWTCLEAAQRNSSQYSYKPAWGDEPYAVPDGWPCRKRETSRYIEKLRGLAQRAFHNMGSEGKVVAANDRFVVLDHRLPFRPARLFGLDVEYISIDNIRPAMAL